ncbi:MAG: hypothetical protein AAF409_19470 [Pseudomonadota bacterium]
MEHPTSEAAVPALARPGWWRRHALALVVGISMPLIFLVMTWLVQGMTPGGPCPTCDVPAAPAPLPSGLEAPARAAADVGRWVAHTRALAPDLAGLPVVFEWQRPADDGLGPPRRTALAMAADDMRARYAVAVPLVLMVLVSVPVWITAFLVLRHAPRIWQVGAIGLSAVGAVVSWQFEDSHPVRVFVAEHLLGRAALASQADGAGYTMITPEVWVLTFGAVDIATVMAVSASTAVFVVFAWLALADPGGPGAQQRIQRRARTFKLMLGLGALVLVLAVAAAHELLNWSAVLLAPDTRAAVQSLASSAGLYWGALYSLVLVGMAVPAAVSIQLDLHRLAAVPDAPTVAALGEEVGFQFDLRHSVTTLMTLAGPVLTGPALELIKVLSSSG